MDPIGKRHAKLIIPMLLGKAVGDRIRRAIDDTLHLLVTTLLANTEDGQAFWKLRGVFEGPSEPFKDP